MSGNVTQDQLIKFVYGELSFEETSRLYDKLDSDPKNMKNLEEVVEIKNELDQVRMKPSNDCIQSILKFSRDYFGMSEIR